jgi:4-alpha-glucanotransferase
MTTQASTLLSTPAGSQWREIGVRQHHGINLPLFALRSQQSCGIGEYTDLLPMIDWCKKIGLDVIQLLPLNDGGLETSPYCSVSATALNSMHLGLSQLRNLEKIPNGQILLDEMRTLSQSQRVDYEKLGPLRDRFLRAYFQYVGDAILNSYDYLLFLSRNPWIDSYALFKAIKIQRNWEPWEQWPAEIRDPTPQDYQHLLNDFKTEMNFQRMVQYLCFQQLRDVKNKASQQGILLKGDIPILINRESADVWRYRTNFRLDYAAGAPPDMYSKEGQKWGFPLYDWNQLEQNKYEWWIQRLKAASSLYHLYRIDHIVGFFRIWAIPLDKPAKEGLFIPTDVSQWIPQGEKIMRELLANSPLLPIGEDLGVIPPEVRLCMKRLGICSTKVMRWERVWNEDKRFIDPKNYPIESMTTVSTHDSDTLFLWWEKNPEEAKEYAQFKGWSYTPELQPQQHQEILYDSHHSASLFHINLLNEYLAIIPEMTWPDPTDEIINVPGVISPRNWTYRFRPYVEEIVTNDNLAQLMHDVIT